MGANSVLHLALLAGMLVGQTKPAAPQQAGIRSLPNAHAHNDYLHARPLLDALDHGFTSIEADIFLVDGQLLVAHARKEVSPERTLQKLYLDPLRERIRRGDGKVFPDGTPLTLLIDIKADAEGTYAALAKVLVEYEELITVVRDGKLEKKPVTVVISGERASDTIRKVPVRHAGLDGRLSDLDSDLPSHLLPLISDNWGLHFRWRGEGEFPAAERDKLFDIVKRAHTKGRRVRFWATPEKPAAWRELRAAGVDLVGTDDLPALAKFLRDEKLAQPKN